MCDRWNDRVFPDADLSEMSIIVTVFCIFTGRNEVVAKVMFLLVSVILLMGGVSDADPPPRADTPPEQTPPG